MNFLFFILAILLAALLTPLSNRLARRIGAVDQPGVRKIHQTPTPRLGGVAMYGAFWLLVLWSNAEDRALLGVFLGSTLLLAAGIYDDTKGMRPLLKFLFQLAAAAIPFAFGLSVDRFVLPGLGHITLGWFGYAFALFWIVGLINTVNLSDGMDGLAAGICAMAALTLAWSAAGIGQHTASLLMLLLAGVALGFLIFNFHPAKAFMGDSGSMFLGHILGCVSLMGTLKTTTVVSLLFPLLLMGVPLIDIIFAIVRRKLTGRPISRADRGHLHHRLLDVGCSQRQAVLVLYGISLIFGVAAILTTKGLWLPAVLLIIVDVFIITLIMSRKFEPKVIFSEKKND